MRMVFPTNMSGRFFDDLAAEMNSFVENVLGEEAKTESTCGTSGGCAFAPRMDVVESGTAFELSLELPGVNPDAVEIEMEDEHIVIHGKRGKGFRGRKRRISSRGAIIWRVSTRDETTEDDRQGCNHGRL